MHNPFFSELFDKKEDSTIKGCDKPKNVLGER
jgi:hypothetical protein